MGRYEELGVRGVINASATLTRPGGSRMPPSVLAVVLEALRQHLVRSPTCTG